jgi:hypothetical protein
MMEYRSLAGWLQLSGGNSADRATQAKDGCQADKVAWMLKKSTEERSPMNQQFGLIVF